MKKLIVDALEARVVLREAITPNDIVGIEFDNGHRAFIQKVSGNEYIGAGNNQGLSSYNAFSEKVRGTSPVELLDNVAPYKAAYVFDSEKELYTWILESLV